MALDSDLMAAALEVYGVLKVAGKDKGLYEARRNLGARWRSSRQGAEEPEGGSGSNG